MIKEKLQSVWDRAKRAAYGTSSPARKIRKIKNARGKLKPMKRARPNLKKKKVIYSTTQ